LEHESQTVLLNPTSGSKLKPGNNMIQNMIQGLKAALFWFLTKQSNWLSYRKLCLFAKSHQALLAGSHEKRIESGLAGLRQVS